MDSVSQAPQTVVSGTKTSRETSPLEVVMLGASIRSSSVSSLEALVRAIGSGDSPAEGLPGVSESAILQTCNRVEFYLATNSPEKSIAELKSRMDLASGADRPSLIAVKGSKAVEHLFEVSAGLDSVVLGESQILAQVRSAGIAARRQGAAKGVLSPLFDRAFRVGRGVRESERLGGDGQSLGSLAVLIANRFGKKDADVLLIGTGKMMQIAAKDLGRRRKVYVASKRRAAPSWLENGLLVGHGEIHRLARKCGIVIAATTSLRRLVSREDLAGSRGKVVIDLGMPRNVSPDARGLPGVTLFDLGDLAAMETPHRGPESLERARGIVEDEASEFYAWLVQTRLTSAVSELHSWAGKVRDEEVLRALRKLGKSDPRDRRVVEAMARRIVSRIMARPTEFARERYEGLTEDEKLDLLSAVFRLGAQNGGE